LKGQQVNDDELNTIIIECENIINSRPLIPVNDDPDSEVLTPNHILIHRSGESFPLGLFDERDAFVRKKWRHVQFVCEQFWKKFTLHYFHYLHTRTKWFRPQRNLKVGDYVAIQDKNLPRRLWIVGVIIEVFPSEDNLVRTVKVRTRTSELLRSVQRVVLLEGVD